MRRWMSMVVVCAAIAACDDTTDVNVAPHDSGTPEASAEGGADGGKDAASDATND